jgi:hypothetical protein
VLAVVRLAAVSGDRGGRLSPRRPRLAAASSQARPSRRSPASALVAPCTTLSQDPRPVGRPPYGAPRP